MYEIHQKQWKRIVVYIVCVCVEEVTDFTVI